MNEKGFALVTVLLLGSISMVLIALGTYLVSSGTIAGGIQKRYQSELEIASGVGELLMGQLILDTLTCTAAQSACVANTAPFITPTSCSANAQIYFSPAVCTALDKPNCNNISACYLSSTPDPVDTDKQLVSVKIVSLSGSNESAIIDVVYKIEEL